MSGRAAAFEHGFLHRGAESEGIAGRGRGSDGPAVPQDLGKGLRKYLLLQFRLGIFPNYHQYQ